MTRHICSTCHKEKEVAEFYLTKTGQRIPACLICRTERRKELGQKRIEFVNSKKVRCQFCGYDKCKAALDFHHLDGDAKHTSIGLLRTSREDKLMAEISKCVVLCSNCHRELHKPDPPGRRC
jgi:hypothetical protein